MEELARIRELRGLGLATVVIDRRLGCSRNTVLKHMDATGPPRYSPRPSGTQLASFQDHLRSRLAEFPVLSTTLLFEEIRQRGYTGSYSVLPRYLRPLLDQVNTTLRINTVTVSESTYIGATTLTC